MIETVLFDLDDTILDFHRAEHIALSKTLTEMGIDACEKNIALYSEINSAQWKLLELGKLTREEVMRSRFELFFKSINVTRSVDKAKELYEGFLSIGHFFMPEAIETLDTLVKKYNLYIVSNGTYRIQKERIASADISKYFKEIFISERVGYNKPDVRFFDKCFEKIGDINRERTIIIGDSLSSDILGGINAGIHTCLYNPSHKKNKTDIVPEYETDILSMVPAIIAKV